MARTKYHKFRGGERCDECGARQWFAQDALRYCRNGHRLEGFADHEADEDAFGTQGRVSRKKKEARRKVAVKLAGDDGRELYLEVLQLILIRQIQWLVDTQGFPDDFTELVRALWTLRVRDLPLRRREGGREGGAGKGYESEEGASSAWFSSQGESSDLDNYQFRWEIFTLGHRRGIWNFYLPYARFTPRIGGIANLLQLNTIPRNVRDRLPPEFHSALQVRDHIPAGRLQNAVQHLVKFFKVKYDMIIPPLNYVPVILRLITDLVLPVDVYIAAKCIKEILEAEFCYPTQGGKKLRTMHNPEVLLVSLIVVSTKLLYSLDGIERFPISQRDPRRTKIDWQSWQNIIAEKPMEERGYLRPGEEYNVTGDDAMNMDKTKLDDYMDWFEKMWVHNKEPQTTERVRDLFEQKRGSTTIDQSQDFKSRRDQTTEKYDKLREAMEVVDATTDSSENAKPEPRNLCPVWRQEADLPGAAKVLYSKAAGLAAIPLATLLRGSAQVERQIELWCIQRSKKKGKGKDRVRN
ncbi:hypothetical protein RRF57_000624 [Xylaria bambusicola]|uniref:RRN7-type domain-containing protein n=1 Tax=Xylaria bambusicola TaxID=326684 RepID=A0AAN7Z0V1_9PEZI